MRLGALREAPRAAITGVYAAIFLVSVLQSAIIPLVPVYQESLQLSAVETGALLAAASFGTIIAGVPAGLLIGRGGSRWLTICGVALIAGSALLQAGGESFGVLLLARAILGVAYGTLWTSTVAWLHEVVPEDNQARVVGSTITISGVGYVTGPALTGILSEAQGTALPLILYGTAGALCAAGLVFINPTRTIGRSVHVGAKNRLKTVSQPLILGAMLLMIAGGSVTYALNLIAPLQLAGNGLGEATIGVIASTGYGIFILSSFLTARAGLRCVNLRFAGIVTACQGLVLILGVVGTSSLVVGMMMLMRPIPLGGASTIIYPLAIQGASRIAAPYGAVVGGLNVVWGTAALVGPLVAGRLSETIGDQGTYAALVGLSLGIAVLLGQLARRPEPRKVSA